MKIGGCAVVYASLRAFMTILGSMAGEESRKTLVPRALLESDSNDLVYRELLLLFWKHEG
jgi:hypothetical protein